MKNSKTVLELKLENIKIVMKGYDNSIDVERRSVKNILKFMVDSAVPVEHKKVLWANLRVVMARIKDLEMEKERFRVGIPKNL